MSGLFGGGGGSTYVPPQPEVTQEVNNAKKGATDIEKLRDKQARKQQYGGAVQFKPNNILSGNNMGDTTLASGSLLSLGGPLG